MILLLFVTTDCISPYFIYPILSIVLIHLSLYDDFFKKDTCTR